VFGGLRSGRLAVVFFGTMGVVSGVNDKTDVLWFEPCFHPSIWKLFLEHRMNGEADDL
jgi:hypothetical protein